jgi:parallel beta-helix repeat protein
MERRIKKIGILLIAILFFQLTVNASGLQISKSTNNYVVVDKSSNGDYTSIQQAIDDSESGTTIFVKNGEYFELIEINKKITLIGEDKENTIINPVSKKNKYAVLLSESETKIEGFTIKNRGPGIYASSLRIIVDSVAIENCNIVDTPVGITVWSSNNIINNCYFSGCTDEGIALIGSTYLKCENNRITNCTFYDNCDGIELQLSSENYIANCEFYENTHTGIDAIRESNNNNIITNCKIYRNQVHGIYFASSNDNQIINCEIYDNFADNIVFNKNSKNNLITDNNDFGNTNFLIEKITNIREKIIQNLINHISNLESSKFLERLKSVGF